MTLEKIQTVVLGSSHTHSLIGCDGTTGFKDGQINIDLRMAAACGKSGRSPRTEPVQFLLE
tara:strand:- start:144 stop:326 length:183 start_codon:yes stop_codon:yes gene_type:complete